MRLILVIIKRKSGRTHLVRYTICDPRAGEKTYLDNGRAGDDGVVGDLALASSKDDVGLSGETLGDLERVASADGLGLDEGRTSDSDEGSVELGTLSDNIVVL